MDGVVGVMTAKDIKGSNNVGLAIKDEPLLCADDLPVLGSPIAAVAALTKKQALAAAEAVKVEYEVLPRMATVEEALAEGAPQVLQGSSPTCVTRENRSRATPKRALASPAYVVEGDFSTPHDPSGPPGARSGRGLSGRRRRGRPAGGYRAGPSRSTPTPCLQEALGWGNIRYKEAFTGGQFGIKVDITSEGLAGAAALHFKRPVRYIPSLTESMG